MICEIYNKLKEIHALNIFQNHIRTIGCTAFNQDAIPKTKPETVEYALAYRHLALEDLYDLNEITKAKWQNYWLACCLSSKCDYIFEVLKPCSIDREVDLRQLWNGKQPLRKEAEKTKKGKEFYQKLITDWLLRRYNWADALEIITGIKKTETLLTLIILSLILMNILFLIFITSDNIDISSLYTIKKEFPFLITEYQKAGIVHYKETPALKTLIEKAVTGFPLIIEFVSAILLAFLIVCLTKPNISKFLFPRLLGAIFIGLLPLITQNNMWSFPLKLTWGQVYMISAGAFLVALIYLTHECGKVAFLTCAQAMKRALPIMLYGLLASLALSIVICDIMAWLLIEYDKIYYTKAYIGIFGLIYPKVVVFFASTALLIGIFVQIFWEEKTITEPL